MAEGLRVVYKGSERSALLASKNMERPVASMACAAAFAVISPFAAAMISAASLPVIPLLQFRLPLDWLLSLATSAVYHLDQGKSLQPIAQPDADESVSTRYSYTYLLLGPPSQRPLILVRSVVYWFFSACWWASVSPATPNPNHHRPQTPRACGPPGGA